MSPFSLPLDANTLKSYEAYLRLQKSRSDHTVRAYIQTINQLLKSHSKENSAVDLIRNFLKKTSLRSSKTTQALKASAIRNFIKWHPKLEGPQKNHLYKFIQSPRIPKRIPRILNIADVETILKYIRLQQRDEQILFFLLYGSGLRISEALNVQIEDVHVEAKSLRVLGKGAKERIVPITEELLVLIRQEPHSNQNFYSAKVTETLARSWVRRWGSDLNLETTTGKWHPHKLRHSIASHMLQLGAKVPQIQKLLGHEQLTTTEKYTHVNPLDLIRIYKKSMPVQ